MTIRRDGGYEAGYAACPCFWGTAPGRYVLRLLQLVPEVSGLRVLDAGCGEGKNAALLAKMGAEVTAVDLSERALETARSLYSGVPIRWMAADVMEQSWPSQYFDVVIAYGLFHCMASPSEITYLHNRLGMATRVGGYHVVCAFNDRSQDLSGHPNFNPCLTAHHFYQGLYRDWEIVAESDEDLYETHPHNRIPHMHSLTRLLARRRS
jgi:tellurite methyltransferase